MPFLIIALKIVCRRASMKVQIPSNLYIFYMLAYFLFGKLTPFYKLTFNGLKHITSDLCLKVKFKVIFI